LGDNSTILRLIYPFSSHYDKKLEYVRKPLSLFDQGKLYQMFSDQQVSVVFVDDVATTLDKIIEKDAKGVFHASSKDTTTPYELTSYVIEQVRGVKNVVKPCLLDDFLKSVGNPVIYPKYGVLKVEKTEERLCISFSTWKDMVDRFKIQFI
jgi:dTDP-4-dehydrorhamnose reductase